MRLGTYVISAAFTTGSEYHYFLWAFLGLSIHGFGALALYLRTKVGVVSKEEVDEYFTTTHAPSPSTTISQKLRRALADQFKPMVRLSPLRVSILEELLAFFGVSWFTNVITVCHIVYGTLLFSSMLFISITDTLIIIGRLLASVTLCRIVLTYELASLRRVVKRIERQAVED